MTNLLEVYDNWVFILRICCEFASYRKSGNQQHLENINNIVGRTIFRVKNYQHIIQPLLYLKDSNFTFISENMENPDKFDNDHYVKMGFNIPEMRSYDGNRPPVIPTEHEIINYIRKNDLKLEDIFH